MIKSLTSTSFMAQLVKNPPSVWETWIRSLGWEDPLEKGKATYSGLENFMDCIVHGVAKSLTGLSDFHSLELSRTGFLFFFSILHPLRVHGQGGSRG